MLVIENIRPKDAVKPTHVAREYERYVAYNTSIIQLKRILI